MDEQIWKFTLLSAGEKASAFHADMPRGAAPMSVGWNGGEIVVWAKIDPARRTNVERRYFHLAGTGHGLPEGIGTFPMLGRVEVPTVTMGLLIFHVFYTGAWNTAKPDIDVNQRAEGMAQGGDLG